MATMDVFKGDAFSMMSLLQAIENAEYTPQFLGSLGIFEDAPQRTRVVTVESRDNELALIQTSPIGAPPAQREKTSDKRKLRNFNTVRLAKSATIYADEIQGIRQFGSESELQQVQVEVSRRINQLQSDMELTWEKHRLGAVQGILLDADDTEIYDFFDEFDVAQPTEVTFDFSALNAGEVRAKIESEIVRPMIRASKGAITTGSRIQALVGDQFWDEFVNHEEVRTTYLNYTAASELRNATAFSSFRYAGVDWVNYRGTDDNSTVAIPTDKVKLFPVNAPGLFKRALAPGEFMDVVNTSGVPVLPLVLPDPSGRNAFVTVELYSYPLHICTRPQVLFRAKRT